MAITRRLASWAATMIAAQLCFSFAMPPLVSALDFDALPYQLKSKPQKPIQMDKKNQSLEEIIDRADIPYSFPQPIPLQGINISGLNSKSVQILGENYFVVLNNTHVTRMADLYRENRANGKANFVTVDCVLHPYLGFSNRIYADVIKKHLLPMAKNLLDAMLQTSLVDYKQADDADLRSDIECNVAFLSLGLKLIDSSFPVPEIGSVPGLVRVDYESVIEGVPGRSAIFGREEDFRLYQPAGFYRLSPELIKFYRLKTWLSRLSYPINDVSFDSGGTSANSFRRSVLLYRSLDLSKVEGKPAFDYWMKLVKGLFLLGSQVENAQEKNVYAHDYRSVLRTNASDLKVTLQSLSEPLYRTKLLLAVRRQKPVSLGAASIFDIESGANAKESAASFRLIPTIGAPEEPWLRAMAKAYPASTDTGQICPVGLMDLHAWGCSQASNVLLDSGWALDPNTPKHILNLRKWVVKRLPGGQIQPVENRFWTLLSPQFRLLPDGIQAVVRTDNWASRRMESALAAWLDGLLAIAPESSAKPALAPLIKVEAEPPQQTGKTATAKPSAQTAVPTGSKKPVKAAAARRAARGHSLDPCPDLFQKLQLDAARILRETQALGFSLESNKSKLEDFIRLFQRLESIAQQETRGEPIAPADLSLLSNFDLVLDRIDLPLPAVLSFPGQPATENSGSGLAIGGVNMCLGYPGRLYIVLQNRASKEWTVARGAVYTYYELPGSPLSSEQLTHKIDLGQARPPFWTERFDMVQVGK